MGSAKVTLASFVASAEVWWIDPPISTRFHKRMFPVLGDAQVFYQPFRNLRMTQYLIASFNKECLFCKIEVLVTEVIQWQQRPTNMMVLNKQIWCVFTWLHALDHRVINSQQKRETKPHQNQRKPVLKVLCTCILYAHTHILSYIFIYIYIYIYKCVYNCERSLTLSTLAANEISPTDEVDVGSNQK